MFLWAMAIHAVRAALPDASIVAKCDGSPAQQMAFVGGMIKSLADDKCLNATCSDFSGAVM